MYQQLKGKYQIKDEEPAKEEKTKEALRRIELAEALLKQLEPKLMLAFAGEPVAFSDQEINQLEKTAALFSVSENMVQLAGLNRY
jgi:hypothetical protein